MGIFKKLKEKLAKTRANIAFKLHNLFKGNVLSDDFYDELEAILLAADVGVNATERILGEIKEVINLKHLVSQEQVRDALKQILIDIMEENELPVIETPAVILIVGVNGVGKTTAIGKLAKLYKSQRKTVTIAAADTFRAAAADQLTVWADRADVRIIKHAEGADPGAVVYDAIASCKTKKTDILLVDTAGRLHNKKNLMEELKKINRVIEREYPDAALYTLLVLDATTGQNALQQVEVFDEAVALDGIILNKMDGTAKGGIVLAISAEFSIPVVYVGLGEGIDDLDEFDPQEFAEAII